MELQIVPKFAAQMTSEMFVPGSKYKLNPGISCPSTTERDSFTAKRQLCWKSWPPKDGDQL